MATSHCCNPTGDTEAMIDPFVFQPVTLLLPCTGQGALVIS